MNQVEPDPVRVGIVWQEPAMMQIGKGGLSSGIIQEAKRLLKKHKYIKVRMLRSSLEGLSKKEAFNDLCKQTDANLIGIRGNTAVIYKV